MLSFRLNSAICHQEVMASMDKAVESWYGEVTSMDNCYICFVPFCSTICTKCSKGDQPWLQLRKHQPLPVLQWSGTLHSGGDNYQYTQQEPSQGLGFNLQAINKNPAYGRHQISRPMRRVAPIPQ